MADFKRQGGSLTGREERYDGFEGEPRAVGSSLGGSTTGTGMTGSHHTGHHTGNTGTTGAYDDTTGTGLTGSHHTGRNTGTYDDTTTGKKPSLLDRLNPMKDTDHDGKKGVME